MFKGILWTVLEDLRQASAGCVQGSLELLPWEDIHFRIGWLDCEDLGQWDWEWANYVFWTRNCCCWCCLGSLLINRLCYLHPWKTIRLWLINLKIHQNDRTKKYNPCQGHQPGFQSCWSDFGYRRYKGCSYFGQTISQADKWLGSTIRTRRKTKGKSFQGLDKDEIPALETRREGTQSNSPFWWRGTS